MVQPGRRCRQLAEAVGPLVAMLVAAAIPIFVELAALVARCRVRLRSRARNAGARARETEIIPATDAGGAARVPGEQARRPGGRAGASRKTGRGGPGK